MSSTSFLSDPSPSVSYHDALAPSTGRALPGASLEDTSGLLRGLARRWHRERRRRKVGRAYDMALEIARVLPRESRVLDVGCGSGYIAHHLSATLNASLVGIDLAETTEAPIDYRPFNGTHFPVESKSFDAVLLCYVLHHAQSLDVLLGELHRVLRKGGRAVIYEDIPETWWDRLVCAIHDRKWRRRTGPCTFYRGDDWCVLFRSAGFEVTIERRLSRWRNLAHPVGRRLFVLTPNIAVIPVRGRVRPPTCHSQPSP